MLITMLITILRWAGPAFILLGSVMTAANRGARFTGWGFVSFTAGSASFLTAAGLSGEPYGMVMNGLLAVTGVYGMYRWFGQKAKGEDGARVAERKSAQSACVDTVMSAAKLIDSKVFDSRGDGVGVLADFMVAPDKAGIAYFVVRLAHPLDETEFYGIEPGQLTLADDKLQLACELAECQPLSASDWPATLAEGTSHPRGVAARTG